MKTKKIPVLMITFVICVLAIGCVMAEPLPPAPGCVFYGNVYVGGKPARDGLNVTAEVSGCPLNWTTETNNGTYGWEVRGSSTLIIPSDDSNTTTPNGGTDGVSIVTFFVNGTQASQTATFESGGAEEVDLSVPGTPDSPASPNPSGSANTQYPLYAAVIVSVAVIGSAGAFWRHKNGKKARLARERAARVARSRNRRKNGNR
jgi:hypothetical protein